MNKTGWRFFWSLLLANIVGCIASYLGMTGWNIWLMVAIVFILFAIVLNVWAIFNCKRKNKQQATEDKPITSEQNATTTN